MRTVVVRYETKPDRADENQRLVENVFAELTERKPSNFRYASFRLEDGVSFVHVVVETDDDSNPISLADIDAFAEFQRGIVDRCVAQPVAQGAVIVGSYRFVPG
jgi:galactose-1-phosphate uridylyltransferase